MQTHVFVDMWIKVIAAWTALLLSVFAEHQGIDKLVEEMS